MGRQEVFRRMRTAEQRARRGKPRPPVKLECGDVVWIDGFPTHHHRQRVGHCIGAELLREWKLGYSTHWFSALPLVIADTPVDRRYKCKLHVGDEVLVDKVRFWITEPGLCGGDHAKLVPVKELHTCVSCGLLQDCTMARNPWDPIEDDVEAEWWCGECLARERAKVVAESSEYVVTERPSILKAGQPRWKTREFKARSEKEARAYAREHYPHELARGIVTRV